jgi:hypothetical protein
MVSGNVNVSAPWKPGSRSSRRSRTGRERIDLLAIRMGLPRERRSMSAAFVQTASRSMKAKGACTSANTVSNRS